MRRLARLAFSSQVLMTLTKGTFKVVETHVPDDAEIRGVNYNVETDCVELILESKEFSEIQEGMVIPYIQAMTIMTVE